MERGNLGAATVEVQVANAPEYITAAETSLMRTARVPVYYTPPAFTVYFTVFIIGNRVIWRLEASEIPFWV